MEEWRDIKGYEGLYQVSNMGNVRSVAHSTVYRDGRVGRYEGKMLVPHDGSNGYKSVNLSKNGVTYLANIHRLVAETFLRKDDERNVVNHKDGNKHNNTVGNLEWVTYSENSKHAARTGLLNMEPFVVAGSTARKKKIAQIDASGKTIKVFDSAAEAARQLGLSKGNISSCANGARKTSGGYRWQFVQGVEICAS